MTLTALALDPENSIYNIAEALTAEEQELMHSIALDYNNELAQPTLKVYGNRPKFYDLTFNNYRSFDNSSVPSNHYKHAPITVQIDAFSRLLKERFDQFVPNNASVHYNCNLVYYAPHLGHGGSRGKHQDNPKVPLSLVLIYSSGQDRKLAIYKDNKLKGRVILKGNSLFAMAGPTFQKVYHHQLEKLDKGDIPLGRWSFNTRFMDPLIIE
jgi:hypothetical protein